MNANTTAVINIIMSWIVTRGTGTENPNLVVQGAGHHTLSLFERQKIDAYRPYPVTNRVCSFWRLVMAQVQINVTVVVELYGMQYVKLPSVVQTTCALHNKVKVHTIR